MRDGVLGLDKPDFPPVFYLIHLGVEIRCPVFGLFNKIHGFMSDITTKMRSLVNFVLRSLEDLA
jgi:hypothetical protein